MKYKSAAAFRQVLEVRLREQSVTTGVPLTRLRKMVAFDRLLARLAKQDQDAWIIKGGLAMQLRLGDLARTTRDIDAAARRAIKKEQAATQLRRVVAGRLDDWFEFEAGAAAAIDTGAPSGGLRFPIHCLLDGRTFERFHLDLGIGDAVSDKPEKLPVPALLEFAGIPATVVPCYSVSSQIAEKLHAYTRRYPGGESSRVRDLVDIALLASWSSMSSRRLRRALQATFDTRDTHTLPMEMPQPPGNWPSPYRRLARDLKLPWPTIAGVAKACAQFLNPILAGSQARNWDPEGWQWK